MLYGLRPGGTGPRVDGGLRGLGCLGRLRGLGLGRDAGVGLVGLLRLLRLGLGLGLGLCGRGGLLGKP